MRAGSVDSANPAGAGTTHVDVGEGGAAGIRIKSGATNQLGVASFNALDRVQNKLDVREVDAAVPVQVGHPAIAFLIDEYVSRVAELVAAVAGAAFAANGEVVRRGTEAGANSHSLGVDSVIVEVFDYQLQLVEERLAEHDVLGPHVLLTVLDEVSEPEMLGHPGVFVLGCDFDEPIGILVGLLSPATLFLGPVAEPVAVPLWPNFLAN